VLKVPEADNPSADHDKGGKDVGSNRKLDHISWMGAMMKGDPKLIWKNMPPGPLDMSIVRNKDTSREIANRE